MSGDGLSPDIRSRYKPVAVPPGQPLPKAAELAPVRKAEKQPRTPLRAVGPKRAEKKAKQFGEQAQRCREAPCCCCGVAGVSEPHHWPTVARGGLDADTCALCPECHSFFHDQAGSPERFLELMGCDVLAEIEKMRRGKRPERRADHECVPMLLEREFGGGRFLLESRYVCRYPRCRRPFSDDEIRDYAP